MFLVVYCIDEDTMLSLQVLFDNTKRAVGVEYVFNGKVSTATWKT